MIYLLRERESILRFPFLLLLANALLVTQVVSAATSDDTKLRGALLKAMKSHDTVMVKAVASSGHQSIDNDEVLQEKISEYLSHEKEYEKQARERAKAYALAKKKAQKKAKAEKAARIAAQKKATPVDTAEKDAQKAATIAADNKQKDAVAARNAEQKRTLAAQKAEAEKTSKRLAAKKAKEEQLAKEEAVLLATQEEKRAKLQKEKKQKVAQKEKERLAIEAKKAEKKRLAKQKAAHAKPLTVSAKKLVGRWKEIDSDKVVTLKIDKDTNFTLEQVEDDGTLTIMGTWKSDEDIFMLSIKRIQRNVHTRETNIRRVYKVVELTKHSLVLEDKRKRIAYDLKR